MNTTATTTATRALNGHRCDICEQPLEPGDRIVETSDEIAHATCIRDWFRRNFGRETLR